MYSLKPGQNLLGSVLSLSGFLILLRCNFLFVGCFAGLTLGSYLTILHIGYMIY